MGFIDGNRPCPPPILKVNGVDMINPEYSLWICQDQPILNVIVGSLSSRIILFITSLKTSKNAWTTLATTYAKPSRGRVMQIKGQLANLYKGSQRVIEYMQQIKSRSDELAMMDAPINSEDLTIKILEELSAEYKDIALAVQARETPISFEELHEKLLNFETHLQHEEKNNHLPITANVAHKMGNGCQNNNLNRLEKFNCHPSHNQSKHGQTYSFHNRTFSPKPYKGYCHLCGQ